MAPERRTVDGRKTLPDVSPIKAPPLQAKVPFIVHQDASFRHHHGGRPVAAQFDVMEEQHFRPAVGRPSWAINEDPTVLALFRSVCKLSQGARLGAVNVSPVDSRTLDLVHPNDI